MSVQTMYLASCQICDLVATTVSKIFNKFLDWSIATFEVVGTAKAVHQLTLMGYHKEAKELMTQVKEMKKNV